MWFERAPQLLVSPSGSSSLRLQPSVFGPTSCLQVDVATFAVVACVVDAYALGALAVDAFVFDALAVDALADIALGADAVATIAMSDEIVGELPSLNTGGLWL
jgi:hypothetical protein